jgi:hypothetical protein
VSIASATIGLLAYKLHLLEQEDLLTVLTGSAALPALGILVGWLVPIRLDGVARLMDERGQFADRFGTSLAFAHEADKTPFMEAQLAEAKAQLSTARAAVELWQSERNAAIQALRVIVKGLEAKSAIPALVKALQYEGEHERETTFVRCQAADLLGSLGPEAKPAVPALVKTLEDADAFVRLAAAKAVVEISPETTAAVQVLIQALQYEGKDERETAFFRTEAAHALKARAIVAFTQSGFSARLMSQERPDVPIIALTPLVEVQRRLGLSWGVSSRLCRKVETTDEMIEEAEATLLGDGSVRAGDTIVIISGAPMWVAGTTNLLKLHRIGERR